MRIGSHIKISIPSLFPFLLLLGILRSTDIADDNSFVYWDKQGWRLLCTTECIFVYVHWPNHHMGSAQLLCITSHCIPQRNFRMVAGVLFNHLLPDYIYIYMGVCVLEYEIFYLILCGTCASQTT